MIKARASALILTLLVLAPGFSAHAADVQTITHGREVDLEDHLVPGKYVLFDFYADWCGPCRALEPQLRDLAGRHADELVIRKVDIINWDSAVSRQYRVSSIPYMILYGPDGVRVATGDAHSVMRRLQSALGSRKIFSTPGDRSSSLVPLLAIAAIFAVAVGLVARKRRTPTTVTAQTNSTPIFPPVDTAANPGDPAIWFVLLQGSLDGPFTRQQLGELVHRGTIELSSTARRRGDASWTSINDVLD